MANGYGNDANVTIGVMVDQTALNKVAWPGDYTVKIKQEVDSSGLSNAKFLGNYTQTVTQRVEQDSSFRKKLMLIGDHTATTHMQLDDSALRAGLARLPSFGNNTFTIHGQMSIHGQQDVIAAYNYLAALPSEFYVNGRFNGEEALTGLQKLTQGCTSLAQIMGKLDTLAKGGDKSARNLLSALNTGVSSNSNLREMESRVERIRNMMSKEQLASLAATPNWQKTVDLLNYGRIAYKFGDVEGRMGFNTQYRKEASGYLTDIEKRFAASSKEAENLVNASNTLQGKIATLRAHLDKMEAGASGKFTLQELASNGKNPYQDVLNYITKLEQAANSGKIAQIKDSLNSLRKGEGTNVMSALRKEYDSMMNLFKNKTKAAELGLTEKDFQEQTRRLATLRTEYINTANSYSEAFKRGGTAELISAIDQTQQRMAVLRNEINEQAGALRTHHRINNSVVEQYQTLAMALDTVREKMAAYASAGINDKSIIEPLLKAEKYIQDALAGGSGQVKSLHSRTGVNSINALIRDSDTAAKWMQRYEEAVERGATALAKLQRQQEKGLSNLMETESVKKLQKAYDDLVAAKGKAMSAAESDKLVQSLNSAIRGAELTAQQMKRANLEVDSYIKKLDQATSAQERHKGVVGDLGTMLAQTYSVYALKQYLSSLIEIGGQFAYQRAAISHILQDSGKANALFNQIKEMALKSPFSTIELDNYAKQLSSYDVEYHELFTKLKKMADISAGVGADMSRLILAYGHVQATGYLEGMQRRQFSNNNINIMRPLAEMYTRQEGQKVTVKDVFKRISEKNVSAADLDKVLMAMAEPGGRFYNMQEAMADTTKAVWKNLGDAINHMYMGIEEQNRGILKGVGLGLTELTKVIVPLVPLLSHLAIAFGVLKLAQWGVNKTTEGSVTARIKSAEALNAEEVKTLKLAQSYRKLSESERQAIATGKALTEQQFQQIVLGKKMSAEQAALYKQSVRNGGAAVRGSVAAARMSEADARAMLFGAGNKMDDEKWVRQQFKNKKSYQSFLTYAQGAGLMTDEQVLAMRRSENRKGVPSNAAVVSNAKLVAEQARLKIEQQLTAAVGAETAAEEVRASIVSASVKNDLLKMAAMGEMSAELRMMCLEYGVLTEAELAYASADERMARTTKKVANGFVNMGKAVMSPQKSIKSLWGLIKSGSVAAWSAAGSAVTKASLLIVGGIQKIGIAMKSLLVEFLPIMLAFEALELIFKGTWKVLDIVTGKESEEVKKTNEALADSYKAAADACEDMAERIFASWQKLNKDSAIQANDTTKANMEKILEAYKAMNPDEVADAVKTMRDEVKNNSPVGTAVLNEIGYTKDKDGNNVVRPMTEQAALLYKYLVDSKNVINSMQMDKGIENMDAAAAFRNGSNDYSYSNYDESDGSFYYGFGNNQFTRPRTIMKEWGQAFSSLASAEGKMARLDDKLAKSFEGLGKGWKDFIKARNIDEKSYGKQMQLLRSETDWHLKFLQQLGKNKEALDATSQNTIEKYIESSQKYLQYQGRMFGGKGGGKEESIGTMTQLANGFLERTFGAGSDSGSVDALIQRHAGATDAAVMQLNKAIHDWFVITKGESEETANEIINMFDNLVLGIDIEEHYSDGSNNLEDWKKGFLATLEDGGKAFVVDVKGAPDFESMRDAAVKGYKEAKETWQHLGALEFGINFKPTMNKASIKQSLDKARAEEAKYAAQMSLNNDPAAREQAAMMYQFWKQFADSVEKVYQGFDKFEGAEGAKADWQRKTAAAKKTHKDTADKVLQGFRKELGDVKNLINVYKQLKDKYGELVAVRKLSSGDTPESKAFQSLFGEGKKYGEFNYANILEILQDRLATALKGGKDKDGWKDIAGDITEYIFNFKEDHIQDQVGAAVDIIEREFEKNRRRLDLFNKMFNATHNKYLASKFAFEVVKGDEELAKLAVNDQEDEYIKQFNEKYGQGALGDLLEQTHVYAEFLNADGTLNRELLEKQAKPIQDDVQKTYQNIEENRAAIREQVAGLIGEYQDATMELANAKAEMEQKIAVLEYIKKVIKDEEIKKEIDDAIERMRADIAWKEFEQTGKNALFFGLNADVFHRELSEIGADVKRNIIDNFNKGRMSVEDFTAKMAQIDDILHRNEQARKKESEFFSIFGIGPTRKDRLEAQFETGKQYQQAGMRDLFSGNWFKSLSDADKRTIENSILEGNFSSLLVNGADATSVAAAKWIESGQNMKQGAQEGLDGFQTMDNVIAMINTIMEGLQQMGTEMRDAFEAMGFDADADSVVGGMADFLERTAESLGHFTNAAQQAMSGNYFGAAVSTITGVFSIIKNIFQADDEINDALINHSKERVEALAVNQKRVETALKNSWGTTNQIVGGQFTYMRQQLTDLKRQRAELDYQLNQEMSKHNKDKSAIASLREELIDLNDQIRNFASETAKTVFGIDFESWGDRLTDALKNAFDNGQDAALAWESAVGDIMREVSSNMMKTFIIEPALRKVYDRYLGDNGVLKDENGSFITDAAYLKAQLAAMGNELKNAGYNAMVVAEAAYQQTQDLFPASSVDETTGGLTKIGQNFTEENGNLTNSYINAIRTDTSALRTIADSQLQALGRIESTNKKMYDILEAVTTGARKVYVQ